MKKLRPALLLTIVCALLWFVIPWWAALAVFVLSYGLLSFLAYQNVVRTVRKVTGLDSDSKGYKFYCAMETGDWSKVPTEDLRVVVRHKPEDWSNPRLELERKIMAVIAIERSRRKPWITSNRNFSKRLIGLSGKVARIGTELRSRNE